MRIPVKPATYKDSLEKLADADLLLRIMQLPGTKTGPAPEGRYRHWDTLRHVEPPEGLTAEEWWASIKWARLQTRRFVPLVDREGRSFSYTMPDPALEMLHNIDQGASGQINVPDPIANPRSKDRYLQSSLIEEAITSSQLEGAATTRKIAKEMLRSGRRPADRSERMILNNYHAMQFTGEQKQRKMTPTLIKEIHRIICKDTLPADCPPPWLRTDDKVAVYGRDGTLLHQPPKAREIPERMEKLCRFADGSPRREFVHPVVRAILLHFWFAYDHPFIDGNGRTARALFYWALLKQGYWLAEFLSISSILRKAPAAYARSFLYTETDENDLTYFILAQLRVINRAIKQLHDYIARKSRQARAVEQMLRADSGLNHRQTKLLGHAMRNPGFRYLIRSHLSHHGVTYATARSDLLALEQRNLLHRSRAGRTLIFIAPLDIEARLQRLGEKATEARRQELKKLLESLC